MFIIYMYSVLCIEFDRDRIYTTGELSTKEFLYA